MQDFFDELFVSRLRMISLKFRNSWLVHICTAIVGVEKKFDAFPFNFESIRCLLKWHHADNLTTICSGI